MLAEREREEAQRVVVAGASGGAWSAEGLLRAADAALYATRTRERGTYQLVDETLARQAAS